MPRDEHAYLSIVQWPSTFDEPAKVDALALALGMDQDTGRLIARRGTPQIAARISSLIRDEVLRVLVDQGVMAFAPTQSELASAGPVRRIKSLAVTPRGITCQMWRQDPVLFKPADLFLIVHGRVKSTTTRTRAALPTRSHKQFVWAAGIRPEIALGMALARGADRSAIDRTTESNQSEQVELFLRNNTRLRLDADKLNFDVLGDQRGYSDHVNMNRLLELVAHLAPQAITDEGFSDFKSPPDIIREYSSNAGNTHIQSTSDQPAFEFYAPWSNILYRRMLGLDRSA